jgi:hypothetical protein
MQHAWGRRVLHIGFWWEGQKERDVGGTIILKRILREMVCEDTDWIALAQDRDQWMGLVKTVMNLWVPYNVGKCLSG